MFVVSIAVAIAVILGYRTRVMVVVLWMLLVSVHVRNPLVLSEADVFLRVLLFWGMFLPLGTVWSLDKRLAKDPTPPNSWFTSMATAALFIQIALVYFFTALLKVGDDWRTDFTAIWYALGAQHLTTPFGA